MTETAKITRVDGDIVTVYCSAEGSANGASSVRCTACGGGSCLATARPYEARNRLGLSLNPGDEVEITVPRSRALGAAVLLFGVPLALFVLFYAAASRLWAGELVPALAGLTGLAAGVLPALVLKRLRPRDDLPEVTALLAPAAQARTESERQPAR